MLLQRGLDLTNVTGDTAMSDLREFSVLDPLLALMSCISEMEKWDRVTGSRRYKSHE